MIIVLKASLSQNRGLLKRAYSEEYDFRSE
jgi:hypothetical protein